MYSLNSILCSHLSTVRPLRQPRHARLRGSREEYQSNCDDTTVTVTPVSIYCHLGVFARMLQGRSCSSLATGVTQSLSSVRYFERERTRSHAIDRTEDYCIPDSMTDLDGMQ